jgi:hypothetical protein
MAEHDPTERVDNPEVEHEESDVNVRGILLFGAVLSVGIAVVCLVLWGLMQYFAARETGETDPLPAAAAEGRLRLPRDINKVPQPRLQVDEARDLEELRRHERERLTTYGWEDRKAGTVRIPVERAMELVAGEGLPVRKQRDEGKKP